VRNYRSRGGRGDKTGLYDYLEHPVSLLREEFHDD
tara:strand:- start:90 stop:194 length:105 start_codon:yes stop_codon:yes gene_type:complete